MYWLIDEYRAIYPTFALTDLGGGLEYIVPWSPLGGASELEPVEIWNLKEPQPG